MVAARRAVVVGGNRIPFARANGAYAQASNLDMLTAAIDGLVARFGLQDARLDDVVAGAVLKHSRDVSLTREAVLGSRLDPHTPAWDLARACDTGLQATVAVANEIALGQAEVGIAGGVDTVSDAPIAVDDDLRRFLLDLQAARSAGDRVKLLGRLRPGFLVPETPRNAEPRTGLSMGEHMAITTARWGIGREEQDELAVASHRNLAASYERGFQDELVTPFLGLSRDDNLRPDTSVEALAGLRPVFGRDLVADADADGDGAAPQATMTAGNSTPLTDGAAVVLLASEAWAEANDQPVLASVVDAQSAAVDHVHGGEGLLLAPVRAAPVLLDRLGLSLQDFDLYEIHEAFASTVLATLAAWEDDDFCRDVLGRDGALGPIDRTRLNPNGSSLATGHPFAATGGRIVAAAARQLADSGGGRALVSICAAGGNGLVAVLER